MISLYFLLYMRKRKIEKQNKIIYNILLLFITQRLIVENTRDYVGAKRNIILLYIFYYYHNIIYISYYNRLYLISYAVHYAPIYYVLYIYYERTRITMILPIL